MCVRVNVQQYRLCEYECVWGMHTLKKPINLSQTDRKIYEAKRKKMEGKQAGWEKKERKNLTCVFVCVYACMYACCFPDLLPNIQKAAENLSFFPAQFSRVKPSKKEKLRIQQRDNIRVIHEFI